MPQALYLITQYQSPQNLSSRDLVRIDFVKQEMIAILAFYPGVLILMGIPGNLLAIGILRSKSLRQKSVSLILTYVAVWNLLNLLINTSRYWAAGLVRHDIRLFSHEFCEFHFSCTMVGHQMVNWTMVIASVAKTMFVKWPNTAAYAFQHNHIHLCNVLMFFALALINYFTFHELYLYELPETDKRFTSTTYCGMEISPGTQAFLGTFTFFLPGLLLISLNFYIVLQYRGMARKYIGVEPRRYARQRTLVTRLAVILFWCEFQIFVTEMPYAIVTTFPQLLRSETLLEEFNAARVYIFAAMLLYTNYSVNFVMYCYFGHHFREVLRRLFRPWLAFVCSAESHWVVSTSEEYSYHSSSSTLRSFESLANLFGHRLTEVRYQYQSATPSAEHSSTKVRTQGTPIYRSHSQGSIIANYTLEEVLEMREVNAYMMRHIHQYHGVSKASIAETSL